MADLFLLESDGERAKILAAMAARIGRTPTVLEKDVWVCWALEQVWAMDRRPRMAFKGGTSLSKVYEVISRFSEDIDVTIDHHALDPGFDPFATDLSRTKREARGQRLRDLVRCHVHDLVVPHLRERLDAVARADGYSVSASDDGEQVWIRYRSVTTEASGYVADSVLLEFGGRNITEPSESHVVAPYLRDALPQLAFPEATVDVLAAERTFWEKATLMHVECGRPEFRSDAHRLSRHWYDLAMLAVHPIGERAVADRALLADVVRYKNAFFGSSHAEYDACLDGHLRLVPEGRGLAELEKDFGRMQRAGLFFEPPPTFEEVVARLRSVEHRVNGR